MTPFLDRQGLYDDIGFTDDQLLKMCKTDGCIHGVGLLDMKYIGKINARSEIRLYLGHKENVIWKIDSEKRTW